MAESSKISIYAALGANFAIAVAKFVGAGISGSSAMVAEGIHSIVDSVNEVLLLYGLRRSQRAPDPQHPLGHSRELYFWSLMVAILIFALGGGFSIYEGVHSLRHPEPSGSALVSYGVLGVAALIEGTALFVSIREFKKAHADIDAGLWKAIRQSKDPSTFIVIFEDAAALVGLVVAFIGVGVSQWRQNAIYDGLASVIIGLLLVVVAIVLVIETKGLLIGESALPDTQAGIREIVQGDEAVYKMTPPITLHLGPADILVALDIEFCDGLSSDQIEAAVRRIEAAIRDAYPEVQRIFVEAASIAATGQAVANAVES